MPGEVLELTDATLETHVARGVALVVFYGAFCPPCQSLESVVADVARDFAGRAVVARIDVDEHNEAAVDHTIEDVPTLILFKDGVETGRLFGMQKRQTLKRELERLLA